MKKFLLATTAVVLAAPALAADLPRRTAAVAPAPAPIMLAMNWTGFYVGLNVGYVASEEVTVGAIGVKVDGFTVGARIGYDWQVGGNWVVGLLGDIDASFAKDTILPGVKVEAPIIASLNVRAGYLITPATLLYVTGGYTYADVKVKGVAIAGLPSSADGFNIGAGLEHRFNSNWSAFVEYRYNMLSLDSRLAFRGFNDDADAHTVKVGVNYRFGGSAAPVVARY